MNRVYARYDDGLFLLAQRFPGPLPTDSADYRALDTTGEVCMVTSDGERLCDFGPDHPHSEN